ncbi:MAG: FAD binding domain-containing protein [Proteobacteria bacterium]|nr:FAD binding domain-containing protein [Pseudomonadota bacterium]
MSSSRIMPEFELLIPQSIKEAVDLLGKLKSKASVMAGGTDVVISMTKGFGSPNVISLAEIPGLDYVEYDSKQGLRIGAMATLQQVADNADVEKHYPALWKSAAINGTPQTRNMGTVVGNIMRASPSGDCCCAILAIGGTIVLRGPEGKREVSIDD